MLVAPAMEGKSRRQGKSFLWTVLSETCLYARTACQEIADRVFDVDSHAVGLWMGKLGPFEIWDAIGVEPMARALEREGKKLPALGEKVLASSAQIILPSGKGTTRYFDQPSGTHKTLGGTRRNHHSKSPKERTAWCKRTPAQA